MSDEAEAFEQGGLAAEADLAKEGVAPEPEKTDEELQEEWEEFKTRPLFKAFEAAQVRKAEQVKEQLGVEVKPGDRGHSLGSEGWKAMMEDLGLPLDDVETLSSMYASEVAEGLIEMAMADMPRSMALGVSPTEFLAQFLIAGFRAAYADGLMTSSIYAKAEVLDLIAAGVPKEDEWRSAADFMEDTAKALDRFGIERPEHYTE